MSLKNISKYISLILRHKPETIGITLDEHGWANVEELINGVSKTYPLTMTELEEIVQSDEKQRYSFNEDKTLIRANQGHSVDVDVELEEVKPPKYLYHGTGEKYISSIDTQGLIPKSRLYVHLSGDVETAVKVGSRHGKPVVYRVLAEKMAEAGFVFYKSVNGVWLTKTVPTDYLKKENYNVSTVALGIHDLRESFFSNADLDSIEEAVLTKYKWEDIQDALICILLDDQYTKRDCDKVAELIWDAVLEGQQVYRALVIGLLYYRLGDKSDPYKNNLLWSITSKVYDLDYANDKFNPFESYEIIDALQSYGISY